MNRHRGAAIAGAVMLVLAGAAAPAQAALPASEHTAPCLDPAGGSAGAKGRGTQDDTREINALEQAEIEQSTAAMIAVAITDTSSTNPTAVMTESNEKTISSRAIWTSIIPRPVGTAESSCSFGPSRLLWIS